MKKYLIILGLLSCALLQKAYAQYYAPYGNVITTSGDARFLIIVASTPSQCANSTLPGNCSNPSSMVDISQYFYADNSQFSPIANDRTISNFFYMSTKNNPGRAPFKVTAEVFPHTIIVNDDQFGNNYEALKKVATDYPTFNFSRFDTRTNEPNGLSDNSLSAPDGVIDYVVTVWRNGCNENGCGGYAYIVDYPQNNDPKLGGHFTTSFSSGFVVNSLTAANFASTFLHEFAHVNFRSPHYFGANGVMGEYFANYAGWGSMDYGKITHSANSWESWYNGWIELPKTATFSATSRDLDNAAHNGIYTLKDFVNTGDAMRIKLPFVNQYLWLENHTKLNALDNALGWTHDGNGNPVDTKSQAGLWMFVENMGVSRTDPMQYTSNQTNGAKTLSRTGNWDYQFEDYIIDNPRYWVNTTASFSTAADEYNPMGLYNNMSNIRGNFPFETAFPNEIVVNDNYNQSNGYWGFNACEDVFRGYGNEVITLTELNGVWDFYSNNNAFLPGDKVSISSNPVVTNHQSYDPCTSKLSPIYLNGISVKYLSRNLDSSINVEVKFDETKISKNQKFTNTIYVNDIPNTVYDLELADGVTLTLDKSKSPNKHTEDFINPSAMAFNQGAKEKIGNNAKLVVKNESYLYIDLNNTVQLNNNSIIDIDPSSTLCIKDKNAIIFNGTNGKIIYQTEWYAKDYDFNNVTLNSLHAQGLISTTNTVTMPANKDVRLFAPAEIRFTAGTTILPTAGKEFSAKLEPFYIVTQCSELPPTRIAQADATSHKKDDHRHHDVTLPLNTWTKLENNAVPKEKVTEEAHSSFDVYPNPFSNQLSIRYNLAEASAVKIELLDMMGNVVDVLKNESHQERGNHTFDYTTAKGLHNGIYTIVITTDNQVKSMKLIYAK